ncbi:MAG TPA: T9SS type A sorting domain-containing protein [Chitinophagaceae bacterium]|nr:T9SS type A sorting domain-containing protein [Chitinophagaceae bacterium]
MKSKILLLLSALSLTASPCFSQATKAADYYFYAKTGTYSYLSGGTTLPDLDNDDRMVEVSLGFTFRYCGTDYTKIYAGTNGFLSFEALLSATDYAWPPVSDSYLTKIKKGIMPLWEDLTGETGVASYVTTGTAPNRVFTIEFKEWGWDYSSPDPVISFQVRLFEKSNVIQYIYKSEAAEPIWDGTPGGYIGISGGAVTDILSLNNSSSSPTASSTVFTHDIVTKPATDQIYEFSPLPQCAGTPTALKPNGPGSKVCPGAEFALTENVTARSLGNTYQWKSRPAGSGTFTDIAGETSDTLKTNITADRDYQLVTTCTNSGLSSTSATRTVEVLSAPAISASGPLTFCSNQDMLLTTAAETGYTYQWIEVSSGSIAGATANEYEPTASGRYTVHVSTASCPAGLSSDDSLDITVKPAPDAAIDPTPTVTICDGEATILNGSGTGDYQWINGTGPISGATGTTYTTSTAGNFTLEVTNPANGCKDTSDATEVISTPAPTVSINPTVKVRVCDGLTTILNSVTTGFGLSYQWIDGSGPLSGETAASLTTGNAGFYQLVVTAGSCKDTSNTTQVELIALPPANITGTGTSTAICPMDNDYTLQANFGTGYTYQWYFEGASISGASSRSLPVNTAGIYTVKVTDAEGCIQYSDTFRAEYTKASKPNIDPRDIAFCEGNSLMLYADMDKYFVTYQWYKNGIAEAGETGTTYLAGASGSYTLEITDSAHCTTMSNASIATVYPHPAEPLITRSGSRLTTTPFKSYQWYRNGKPLAGETGRSCNVIFEGIYAVEVGNEFGCHSMSADINMEKLGIAGTSSTGSALYVYPNPSNKKVYIDYKSPVTVSVRDLQGREVMHADNTNEIDISSLAHGPYLLTIMDANGVLSKEKIMKYGN